MIRAGVVVASDKGAAGVREDLSGPAAAAMLREAGMEIVEVRVVPDEREDLTAALLDLTARCDVVFTSGGTGLSPRDITPDVTLGLIDRAVPGLAEAMRLHSLAKTPRAMLSRAAAGVRGRSLIINLPGSPKAVRECLEVILPVLPHAVEVLTGQAYECAAGDGEGKTNPLPNGQ